VYVRAAATSSAAVQAASNEVLDQLKSIRSTATALTNRVRKFKSELEDILADDQDMCAAHRLDKVYQSMLWAKCYEALSSLFGEVCASAIAYMSLHEQ
jgi:phage shock protein A